MEKTRGKILLERAEQVAKVVIDKLSPYCKKIEVAGSIRRRRPYVNDLDFVLIPADPWNLSWEIKALGIAILNGDKLKRVNHNGIQLDFYIATPETWATLFLIRTGPTESNVHLCTLAKKRGWHLFANGDGLFDQNGKRIAGDSEQSIFQALGLEYREPPERQ